MTVYTRPMMRDYQQALVAAISAELGGRGWTRKQLADASGITDQTLRRVMRLERDMNVAQLGAIVDALGVTHEYLAAEAEHWRSSSPGARSDLRRPTDPRGLIAWLIANPSQDDVLNDRLSEIGNQTGLSGNALAKLRDEVMNMRRRELDASLSALTPSPKRAPNSA